MNFTADMHAIVTGGASGLGQASVRALADQGMKVTIFDLNEEAGEAIAKEVGGQFVAVNVTDEAGVVAAFEKARSTFGQERILVHCAQTSKNGKTVSFDKDTGGYKRLSTEDFEYSALGILVASYRMASISALGMATLKPLEDGERGTIILTSSAAAQDAQIGQVAYGSCKAGVNGLVLPLARDLMDLGIRVNSIMPGVFATPLLLRAPEKVLEALASSVPFPKRLGRPEEFASLVIELCHNSYFNGQTLRLDGAVRMAPR